MRWRRGIPLSREKQWLILGLSLGYRLLPEEQREQIDRLCRRCGGKNARALKDYVTTETSARAVCTQYYIGSETTLYRAARRYFLGFDQLLARDEEMRADGGKIVRSPAASLGHNGPGRCSAWPVKNSAPGWKTGD